MHPYPPYPPVYKNPVILIWLYQLISSLTIWWPLTCWTLCDTVSKAAHCSPKNDDTSRSQQGLWEVTCLFFWCVFEKKKKKESRLYVLHFSLLLWKNILCLIHRNPACDFKDVRSSSSFGILCLPHKFLLSLSTRLALISIMTIRWNTDWGCYGYWE